MALEFSERVRRIPVYPAAGAYALPEDVALLASNESPYPPIPAVVDAVSAVLGGLNRYPDPTNAKLRGALSDRYGIPAARIAIGNGSCDILLAAGEALLEPGAELVYAWPSFSVYPHLAAASGASAITVALNDRDEHDLEAMAREITAATRLVIVCNPNNPTSTALPADAIAAFVEQVPRHVCVIVDEAYCEFNTLDDPDTTLDLLKRHRNVVLLRTFSKVYGLCGLRVGFGLCGSDEFVTAVEPGAPALLLQRGGPGRGDRGAAPPGRGQRPRRAHDRRPRRGRGRPARAGHRARRVAGQLLLVRSPGARRRGARRRRGPRRASGSASAACSCAPATRSAAPGRCA